MKALPQGNVARVIEILFGMHLGPHIKPFLTRGLNILLILLFYGGVWWYNRNKGLQNNIIIK